SSSTTSTRPRAGFFSGLAGSAPGGAAAAGQPRPGGRETQPEERTAPGTVGDGEVAAVLRDDRVADRQPEAGRLLGRIERLEDPRAVLPGHAGTAVGDL